MKNFYIVFLINIASFMQGSACKQLNIKDLKDSQKLCSIQKAYKVLSPLRNETPDEALKETLRGYSPDKPYLQFLSQEEIDRQQKELYQAYGVLAQYGLTDTRKEEIEYILEHGFSQEEVLAVAKDSDNRVQTVSEKYEILSMSQALEILGFSAEQKLTLDLIEQTKLLFEIDYAIEQISLERYEQIKKAIAFVLPFCK